jgi:hypothetical protein
MQHAQEFLDVCLLAKILNVPLISVTFEIGQIGNKILFHTFDKPHEDDHDFIQPGNIEMVQESQGVCSLLKG